MIRHPFQLGIFWCVIFSTLCPAVRAARVEWEAQDLELHPAADAEEVVAEFKFKNAGPDALNIREVKTSCGCTVAKGDKDRYEPGESGAIRAVFTIGGRTGTQEKVVSVESNDEKSPKVYLKLRVFIPKVVTLQPPNLTWEPGEAISTKKVRATVDANAPVKSLTAKCSAPTLDVRVEPVGDSGKDFDIVVTPQDTEKPIRAVITLTTDWPQAKPKVFSIYVGVR